MRGMVKSNVYYLPQPTAREMPRRLSRWARIRGSLTRGLWRLRITIAEIRSVLRRPARPFGAYSVALDDDLPALPARRVSGPARVIDFESARERLRGVAEA